MENPEKPESEECFIPLRLADGETKTTVKRGVNEYLEKVQLPHGVTCERCVFRWTYKGGKLSSVIQISRFKITVGGFSF